MSIVEKCDVTEIKFYEIIGLVGISKKKKIEKAPPPPPLAKINLLVQISAEIEAPYELMT